LGFKVIKRLQTAVFLKTPRVLEYNKISEIDHIEEIKFSSMYKKLYFHLIPLEVRELALKWI